VSGEGGSFAHLTYHLGGDWRVDCHTYRDSTPILSVGGGPLSLAISTRGKAADEAAVEFARALADGARKFADEMERMYAARLADDDSSTAKAAGCDAA
jgi:hypothetical protein